MPGEIPTPDIHTWPPVRPIESARIAQSHIDRDNSYSTLRWILHRRSEPTHAG